VALVLSSQNKEIKHRPRFFPNWIYVMKKLSTLQQIRRCVLIAVSLLSSQAVLAQETQSSADARTNYLILGAVSIPEFEGAADQTTQPLIAASMRWGYRYIAWDGTNGRFNALNHEAFEFGPVVNVSFGRDDKIEPLRVRKLGEIDDAFEAGLFTAYSFANVISDGDVVRLSAQLLKDVSNTHEGTIGELAASYRLRVNTRLAITATGSIGFANDDYANTYFSVSAAGARSSGLPVSKVEGGTKDAALSVSANYDLTQRWSIFSLVKASHLIGDFADSPIVALEGDKDQVLVGVGIGWRF
jgi:MipA family protein